MGKYVELRDGDKLRPACIYLVVGLGRDGKKRVLSCVVRHGRENLEDWKAVLRGLIERGLGRVMIIIHDDFSGLLPISQGLFPQSDVQLCAVHYPDFRIMPTKMANITAVAALALARSG